MQNKYTLQIGLERQLIGCMLLNPAHISTIQEVISEEDFYEFKNLYTAITNEYMRKGNISIYSLKCDTDIGDLSEMIDEAQSDLLRNHINRIVEESDKRLLAKSSGEISRIVYDDLDEAKKLLLTSVEKTVDRNNKIMKTRFTDLFNQAQEIFAIRSTFKDGNIGVPTGYFKLDECIRGMKPGEYWIIGAATSVGKSAFALNIAINALNRNAGVAYFNYEMSNHHIVERITAMVSEVPLQTVRSGKWNPEQRNEILTTTNAIKEKNLNIFTGKRFSSNDIWMNAKAVKNKYGLDIIIVDYIQQIADRHAGQTTRNDRLTETSAKLQIMAKELDCCVIALSQLNRRGAEGDSDRIGLSALRDSGALEQDADIVIILNRDKILNPERPENIKELFVDIAKNREGRTEKILLNFEYETMRVKNA